MPSDKQTRQQRHQTQVKTQSGKAIRGAQATEFVKGSGFRKTEFIGGKKFFTPMSSDPNVSGAGGDVTNITVTGSSGGAGGDVKSDGTVHFTAPQTGVAPTSDLHLATKKYVDDEGVVSANSITVDKLQQINTDTFLGRDTAGTGNVEVITLGQLETMLQLGQYISSASTNTLTDMATSSPSAGHYLRHNGTAFVNTAFVVSDISGLQASQIPALATSKITSGTFADARISESSVTQHSAAVKSSASLMNNFFFQEADTSTTSVEEDHKVKIVTNNGGAHGTGTISTSGSGSSSVHTITLNTPNTVYSAGTNVSFSGTQINATNTNQLTRFYMRDDDNDAVYLAHDHYVKFATSGGVTTNWSATDAAGSSGDPHILTIAFDQSSITTVGTITSGTWSGSVIPSSKLDADTAHLSGTQTFSGAKSFNAASTMSGLQINAGSGNNVSGQDASLYVSATSDNDWGIWVNKASNEYGVKISVATDSSLGLAVYGGTTKKFSVTGNGVVDTGTWNGSSISATYIDSAIPRLSSTQSFTGDNTFTTKIKVGTTASFPHTDTDLLVGGVNHSSSSAIAQFAGFIRVRGHAIIHDGSSANAVGWMYGNGGLQTYSESSGTQNVYAGADVVAYYSSDPRLKTNKKRIEKPLTLLSKINGYTFDWKKYASKFGSHLVGKDYGVMADEIEEVMPELVHDRDNGYKGVKYEKIVPLLIECIKEQQVQINQLKKWKSDKKWI